MRFLILAIPLLVASVFCDHEKVLVRVFDKRTKTTDDESIFIDLKHPGENGKEDDTEIKVELHFGLVHNEVHCNGYHMKHGQVTRLHLNMMLQETKHGQAVGDARLAPVIVRVFVNTRKLPNGDEVIFAEQQIIAIDEKEVVQVMVHHVYWEKATRRAVIVPKMMGETELAKHDFSGDRHLYGEGFPKHPEHGYGYDHDDHRRHHGHRHHHHHRSVKCWYHHLTKRSKIALFAGASFTLLMVITALACCVRARKTRARTMTVAAPMDDNVTVVVDEKKDAKQLEDEKYKFHFEMDNAVVVDDKKELIS